MGGRQKKSHSSFSIFGRLFKSKRNGKGDHYDHDGSRNEVRYADKVLLSDEESAHQWIVELGLDRKAKDYIDRFYENRVVETERQTVTILPFETRPEI